MISVVDIVLLGIILLFIIVGMCRGFLKSLLAMCGNGVCIVASIFLAKPFAAFLQSVFGMAGTIGSYIVNNSVASELPQFTDPKTGQEVINEMTDPSILNTLIKRFIDVTHEYANTEELVASISNAVGALASIVLSAIIAFVCIRIVILLLAHLFDAITQQKAISGMDRLLGCLFGAIKVAVLIFVVMVVLYIISPIVSTAWMDNTVVFKFMFNYSVEGFNYLLDKIVSYDWLNGVLAIFA